MTLNRTDLVVMKRQLRIGQAYDELQLNAEDPKRVAFKSVRNVSTWMQGDRYLPWIGSFCESIDRNFEM